MKILITGGNGYIGSSLYDHLKDAYQVKKISRDDLDLTNSRQVNDFFDQGSYDVVLHCAVKGGSRLKQDDWKVVDDNLKMYYNLINNKQSFNKFIHFGSGAELYSKNTPYGLSKDIIRQSILQKENCYNLRIFAVFDENELSTRFIKSNIERYIHQKPMIIHRNRSMCFFYMKDLIKLVKYYIDSENPQKEINCCYSEVYTLDKILRMINNLGQHKVDILKEFNDCDLDYYEKNIYTPNIKYIGFESALREVYEKLKSK